MDFSAIAERLTASAAAAVAPRPTILGRLARAMVAKPEAPAPAYVALGTGSLGGFPYYWEDPSTLRFNAETYRWINSAVNGGASPAALSGPFTNRAITVLGSIRFTLSAAQQSQLDLAKAQMTMAQAALLNAWRKAFGASWTGQIGAPIDVVLQTIASTWASPAVPVQSLFVAPDLAGLLSRAPAQGATILPDLAAYFSAVTSTRKWVDILSRQSGYLRSAQAALAQPALGNGGLLLNDGTIVPAFQVETPLSEILASIGKGNTSVNANLIARAAGDGLSRVTFNGGGAVTGEATSVLALETGDGVELAGAAIAAAAQPVSIAAQFEGVTQVAFQPVPFDIGTMTGWFWREPIEQALQASGAGAGFSFSPRPPYDFTQQGQFCWLTGVLIARNPILSVSLEGAAADRIAQAINQDPDAELMFLGQNLAVDDLQAMTVPSGGNRPDMLRIAPLPGAANLGSRAYVLGGVVRWIDV